MFGIGPLEMLIVGLVFGGLIVAGLWIVLFRGLPAIIGLFKSVQCGHATLKCPNCGKETAAATGQCAVCGKDL